MPVGMSCSSEDHWLTLSLPFDSLTTFGAAWAGLPFVPVCARHVVPPPHSGMEMPQNKQFLSGTAVAHSFRRVLTRISMESNMMNSPVLLRSLYGITDARF